MPTLQINLLNEKIDFPMSDSKGMMKTVGNKFRTVFGKGKENKRHEIEKTAASNSVFHSILLENWHISTHG